jgi:NPCBM/NEW2 domain
MIRAMSAAPNPNDKHDPRSASNEAEESTRAEDDSPDTAPVVAKSRAPLIAHGVGIAMAGVFVWMASGWLGSTPPPPAQPVAEAPAQPDATQGAAGEPKRGRRRRSASITGPGGTSVEASSQQASGANPVAVDSGFRREVIGQPAPNGDGQRIMYLSKALLATEENIKGGVLFNKAAFGPVIRAGSAVFDQGVSMFAPEKGEGLASFRVPEGAKQFHASVGFSNIGSPDLKRCESQGGSARFTLFTNGIQKFNKIVVGTDGVHETIKLDIGPDVKTVTLVVDNADGDNTCDAAFWGDARFTVEPPAPAKTPAAKASEPAKAPE